MAIRPRTRLALLLASAMTVMAGAIIAPSLPQMQAALARTPRDALLVRLVLTLPALFTALTAAAAGWLVDRFGRRRVLLAGLALYLVGGSAGLVVANLTQLLLARALLGMAVAAIITSSVTLIADLFVDHERERFLGLQSAFMGLSAMVFLSVGGFLAEQHWRAPFALYFLAVLVAVFVLGGIPEVRRAHAEASPAVPVPPLPVVRIAIIYACGFLGMLLFYLVPVQLPFFLQSFTDAAASRAGIAIGSSTFVGAMMSLQYRRVRTVLGFRSIFAVMFAIVGLSYVWLGRATDYGSIIAALAFGGVGFGLLIPNANVWLSSLAPPERRGRLVGGLMTCLFVGQFASPIVAQPWLRSHGLGGANGVFAASGLLSLAIALAFLLAGPVWKRLHGIPPTA